MSRNPKPKNSIRKPRSFYSIHPWECRHHKDNSEIVAYVEASGTWEVIADIRRTSGASAETMASFITHIINDYEKNQNQMREAVAALELCLENESLSWEAEQAADITIRRVTQKM